MKSVLLRPSYPVWRRGREFSNPACVDGCGQDMVKILPVDWTPVNIARTPVIIQHLDWIGLALLYDNRTVGCAGIAAMMESWL
jgi:hypothetical protein